MYWGLVPRTSCLGFGDFEICIYNLFFPCSVALRLSELWVAQVSVLGPSDTRFAYVFIYYEIKSDVVLEKVPPLDY